MSTHATVKQVAPTFKQVAPTFVKSPKSSISVAQIAPAATSTITRVAAIEALEDKIGYRFNDERYLEFALSHSSWCAENEASTSNQRLEFLGDAVLDLVVSHILYAYPRDAYPHGLDEGQMSQVRATVVSKNSLAEAARDLRVGEVLRVGQGERISGGCDNPSLLADALEALIGAVYLDGGLMSAELVVKSLLSERIHAAVLSPGSDDFKTRLQETAVQLGFGSPEYSVSESGVSGVENRKRFYASVSTGGVIAEGEGSTKKEASQRAAEAACRLLVDLMDGDRADV